MDVSRERGLWSVDAQAAGRTHRDSGIGVQAGGCVCGLSFRSARLHDSSALKVVRVCSFVRCSIEWSTCAHVCMHAISCTVLPNAVVVTLLLRGAYHYA